ncbi:MAG TPA: hypothetical protein PLD47_15045 [Aggregatilineales bacterium]|nr:hypothetical protein [Anaerolineales bacterium]HRE49043.1 hypothetical protein [Aggregatilineales bacterium]
MTNLDDLRNEVLTDEFETQFDVRERRVTEVSDGRIFGMTAGERMILSVILFLAVSVMSVAVLFMTNTIRLP